MLIFYDPLHVSRKLFRCFPGNTTVTKQYFKCNPEYMLAKIF